MVHLQPHAQVVWKILEQVEKQAPARGHNPQEFPEFGMIRAGGPGSLVRKKRDAGNNPQPDSDGDDARRKPADPEPRRTADGGKYHAVPCLLQRARRDKAGPVRGLDPTATSPCDPENEPEEREGDQPVVVGIRGHPALVKGRRGDHADGDHRPAQRTKPPGGKGRKNPERQHEEDRVCPDGHPINTVAQRVPGHRAVNLSQPAQIPRQPRTPMDLAALRRIVEIRVPDPPLAILAQVLRVAVPRVSVECDLAKKHRHPLFHRDVPVRLIAEPDGDGVHQKRMCRHPGDAGEQGGRKTNPCQDPGIRRRSR